MFKNKKIIIIVAIFILAFIGYAMYVSSSKKASTNGVTKQAVSGNTITANGSAGNTVALDGPGKEFVAQLLAIQNISFNLEFFKDPVFQGMYDFSKEIQPQEAGRPNPFAPLGNEDRQLSPATVEQAVSNVTAPKATTAKPAVKR